MIKTKEVKTKCDWCGKEMYCSKNRLHEKQVCLKCFLARTGEMAEIPLGTLHVDLRPDNLNQLPKILIKLMDEPDEQSQSK